MSDIPNQEHDDPTAYAWDWAASYAAQNKLFDQPMKANGYPVDGTKPATPEERYNILEKLALQYMKGHGAHNMQSLILSDYTSLCPHGAILCAPCNYIPESWRPS